MPKRLIAIGDIHGCLRALETLLDHIAPTPSDLLIPLGDYIDRGPDSKGVVQTLIDLAQTTQLIPLRGNHEEMLFWALTDHSTRRAWRSVGGLETEQSYGGLNHIPPEHLNWYQNLADSYEAKNHIFVHANYDAFAPLKGQDPEILHWRKLDKFPPKPHRSGKIAVVGHTPQPNGHPLDLGHCIGIDTHCYAGGWLSALDLNSGTLWQAQQSGHFRTQSLR